MLRKMLFIFFLCFSGVTHANSSVMQQVMPDAQLVGKGRLTYMVWDVYDASLYAPNGKWKHNKPFVLRLDYLRDISRQDIADTAISAMRQQGFTDEVKLAAWHTQMENVFPDVGEGVALIGVYQPNQPTVFYNQKGDFIGQVKDPEFGKYFFAIWLENNTPKPLLRVQLLNESKQ